MMSSVLRADVPVLWSEMTGNKLRSCLRSGVWPRMEDCSVLLLLTSGCYKSHSQILSCVFQPECPFIQENPTWECEKPLSKHQAFTTAFCLQDYSFPLQFPRFIHIRILQLIPLDYAVLTNHSCLLCVVSTGNGFGVLFLIVRVLK